MIYILIIISLGGWQFDRPGTVDTIQELMPPGFYKHLEITAREYGSLEPSQPVIDAFLDEAMLLDDFGEIGGMSHAKRVKYARMARRTAQRESGLGNSRLARKLNNHVGTKLARNRPTWAIGRGYLNYARFALWTHSYLDCFEYIRKYGHSWIK